MQDLVSISNTSFVSRHLLEKVIVIQLTEHRTKPLIIHYGDYLFESNYAEELESYLEHCGREKFTQLGEEKIFVKKELFSLVTEIYLEKIKLSDEQKKYYPIKEKCLTGDYDIARISMVTYYGRIQLHSSNIDEVVRTYREHYKKHNYSAMYI
jgi:hypothetical protein